MSSCVPFVLLGFMTLKILCCHFSEVSKVSEDKCIHWICHAYLEFPLFIFNRCMVFCDMDGPKSNRKKYWISDRTCCLVIKLYLTLCNPMDCSTPGFPVLYYLGEFAQTHVHWVGDAIQLSHPLSPTSPPAFNLSQYQSLFQWISFLHQVAKALGLQHQSFQ